MESRLVRFLLIFVLLLVGLELFVRANGPYFFALSDKMLLKVKILEREPDTKILFLGTSRFLDAIDHHLFTRELETRTGRKLKSLNAATTGLQSERLAYFSKIAAANPGLTHVIIEASPPGMGSDGKLELPGEETTPNEADEALRFPDRFENRLQKWFVDHIALVTYRKAMQPKTLIKLFVLYTANVLDPNIWSRKRPLEAIFLPVDVEVDEAMISSLNPEVISPKPDEAPLPQGKEFENLKVIADIFKGSHVEVIWVAPPVSTEAVPESHNATYTSYYQSIANESGDLFWDYAGQGWDKQYMGNPSHLNSKGRNVFTKVLAAHLTKYFWGEKTVP